MRLATVQVIKDEYSDTVWSENGGGSKFKRLEMVVLKGYSEVVWGCEMKTQVGRPGEGWLWWSILTVSVVYSADKVFHRRNTCMDKQEKDTLTYTHTHTPSPPKTTTEKPNNNPKIKKRQISNNNSSEAQFCSRQKYLLFSTQLQRRETIDARHAVSCQPKIWYWERHRLDTSHFPHLWPMQGQLKHDISGHNCVNNGFTQAFSFLPLF